MLAAYDEMHRAADGAVSASITSADPFLAVFSTEAERAALVEEFTRLGEIGFTQPYRALDRSQIREASPVLGDGAQYGLALENQRFINPRGVRARDRIRGDRQRR